MLNYTNIQCLSRNFVALCAGNPDHHSVVIVMHGLTACKETQNAELERLASAGFFAVAFDAPHHGARQTGLVELIQSLEPFDRHHLMMTCVLQHAAEISAIIDLFRNQGKKVAVIGISMGAYVSFALSRMPHRPDFVASFLGSPDFRCRANSESLSASFVESSGPADFIDELFPLPFFMVTAAQDRIVPPGSARQFYETLVPRYKNQPELLEYHEYPDSQHIMNPEDWADAWQKFISRLKLEQF